MHIWTFRIQDEQHVDASLLNKSYELLSHQEQHRAARFVYDKDRNRFILAHALCRVMLSHFGQAAPASWIFEQEDKGRPYINPAMNDKSIDFNISHTANMVGCALAFGNRVGLDLESKSRSANIETLAKKQFSLAEQDQFFEAKISQRQRLFFEFWTLKEAYIKVTGMGLTEHLSGFGFDLAQNPPLCVSDGALVDQYNFGLFDVERSHQGAWAVEKKSEVLAPEILSLRLPDFRKLVG